MSVKRIVDTNFWIDDKVVEMFSPEDKYFMLYLLTNPHTTQLGIYQLTPKIASFELGYSTDSVNVLLDRFENKYELIRYCKSTKEVAIKNYLVYSIVKGGKPVEDLLNKEIKQVKSKSLLKYVFENLYTKDNINTTVKNIINKYTTNNNDIHNDNDNDVSLLRYVHDSLNQVISSLNLVFSEKVFDAISRWLQYKKEKKQTYKKSGLEALLKRLSKDIDVNGEQYVIDAIEHSMVMNYSGIFASNSKQTIQQPKAIKEETDNGEDDWLAQMFNS